MCSEKKRLPDFARKAARLASDSRREANSIVKFVGGCRQALINFVVSSNIQKQLVVVTV